MVITGPTAVGKTDIALKLAEHISAEIINADVGQCYKPLTIGTAKPSWKDHPAPHHLFDVVSIPQHFTVVDYRNMLLPLLHEIWQRGHVPVVVGGSAFYIKSIFFPPTLHDVYADISEDDAHDEDNEKDLWQQLYALDPERARTIAPQDTYRIKRALALWKQTGKKPSQLVPRYQPPCFFRCVIVNRERDDLYNRINERVVAMINRGWVEEVQSLKATAWEPFLRTKKIIGYDDILDYTDNKISFQAMLSLIQQKTRNYAKRQVTFLKKFESQLHGAIAQEYDKQKVVTGVIEHCNLTLLDLDLYIKQLLDKIGNDLNNKR